MTYHNPALDLPEPPTDAPLMLRVYAVAIQRVADAGDELRQQIERVHALSAGGKHGEARKYLASIPKLCVEYNHALQVMEHGDLNVDALVIEQIPESGWMPITTINNKLSSYDYRLTAGLYRPRHDWESGMTPIDVVIERLAEEGRIKLHADNRKVRRLRKGEKPPA